MRTDDLRLATLALLVCAPLAACVDADDEFRRAVPTSQQVTIAVPGGAANATGQSENGIGVTSRALVGQVSEYYAVTLGVSTAVNGSALALLGMLHAIVVHRATTQTEDSRTWGPWTPGGLDPLTYRATVTRIAAGQFNFSIDARPRESDAEGDFLVLLDGTIARGLGEGKARGTMTLHFDNGRLLRPGQCEQGTVAYAFDSTAPPATVDVTFTKFANNNARGFACGTDDPRDATYHYERAVDGAGDFVFALRTNVHRPEENKPELEEVSVRSRWQGDGQGRADVRIAGGEVQSDLAALHLGQDFVLASQCWNGSFTTVYETSSPPEIHLVAQSGDAGECVFTSQDLP